MKYTAVVPIVEGHGEVRAFPALLFRVREVIAPKSTLKVNAPIRVKVGKFLNSEKEFYRHVRLAAERAISLKDHVLNQTALESIIPMTIQCCPSRLVQM
jgi:hypothetical protein